MRMTPLSWQSLIPSYAFPEQYQQVSFFDFQPNAKQALNQFCLAPTGSVLVLKSETLPEFLAEIADFFAEKNMETVIKTEFDRQRLFGSAAYFEKENRTERLIGAVEQADSKVLVLNLNTLLLDIAQWDKLKQAVLFGEYNANTALVPNYPHHIKSTFKLILVGSRDDIATLFNYDDSLYQFSQYAEVDNYLNVEQHVEQWAGYVQTLSYQYTQKTFSQQGLNQLLSYAIRQSESQALVSISPSLLRQQLLGISRFYPDQPCFDDIQGYFDYLEQQSATLSRYALQDIVNHQLHIETDGEEVGQINGLSVVEFDGVPHAFGEPLRISCNVQYGDGEIHDIERKVELGGNIHSKGILIAQSCLANLLEFPTQLPFSASLAFEQSYGEIDGDSSALAIFCVLISALTKLPLPQSTAITGSIDQFGNVLSVGGVNQKIEGFYQVCEMRGLTGKQGVIIPTVCLSHLSLKPAVIEAIKAGKFHLWAVNDVFEAIEILLEHVFYDEDLPQKSEKPSIFSLVHQYVEQNQQGDTSGSIWQKICKLLKRD